MGNTHHLLPHGQWLGSRRGLEPFDLVLSRMSRAGWCRSHSAFRAVLLVKGQQDVCQAGLVTNVSLLQSCPCQQQELPTSQPAVMGKEQRFEHNPEVAGCVPRQTSSVDITKASSLPFNLSQPMEFTSV